MCINITKSLIQSVDLFWQIDSEFIIYKEQMNENLQYMLNTIAQISKNTQNFNQLEELLPLLNDLRKSDIDNKEVAQYLKLITELFPKLKAKMQLTNRGESLFEVYDRMTSQINLQINKFHAEFEEVRNNTVKLDIDADQQIKVETNAVIKDIQEILAANKKTISNYMNVKTKQYIGENSHHYLDKKLVEKINERKKLQSQLENCKNQFGQYRCIYNLYESQSRSPQLLADHQKLKSGKATGLSEQGINKLEKRIELQKRKEFVLKSCQHIEKQYSFVVKNLKKFDQLVNPRKYQEKMFYHYHSWGKRLKVLLQTILIKLSTFQSNRLGLKQQEIFIDLIQQIQQKYQKQLYELQRLLLQ